MAKPTSPEYEEFLESFNAHGVKYLVVGAHAVAFHARPRATKDLDLFIAPTADNAARALAALRDLFGGFDLGVTEVDLTTPGRIVQLGIAPARIDLLASLSGIPDFEEAWERRIEARFGASRAPYLSLDDLIRAKQSANRDQDRADLRSLERARKARKRESSS